MIIVCHGHCTTAPKALQAYRDALIAGLKDPSWRPTRAARAIGDDQIWASIEGAQLKLQRGAHTRSAVGMAALALHISVEIEAEVEVSG